MCLSPHVVEGEASLSCPCRRFPILIIAPSSVLDNWSREFQTWGSFNVCMYSEKLKSGAVEGVLSGRYEVMLISFDTYRSALQPVSSLQCISSEREDANADPQ